jgi:hypothetical protein
MKKQFLFLALFFLWTMGSISAYGFQFKPKNTLRLPGIEEEILGWRLPTTASKWPFNKGAIWVNLGTSFGILGQNSLGSPKGFFPIQLAVDYSISPHFSVGPYIGYYKVTYKDSYNRIGFETKRISYIFGGRVLMHLTDVINNATGADINLMHWDLYAGLSAGIVYWNWKKNDKYVYENSIYSTTLYPSSGLVVGVKYLINPSIDIFAETGRGMFGLVSFGISGKIH